VVSASVHGIESVEQEWAPCRRLSARRPPLRRRAPALRTGGLSRV